MTELDQVIAAAFASEGKQEDVNKVYLAFLRANLFMPVRNEEAADEAEPFSPLFARVGDNHFLIVFDTQERLMNWFGDQKEDAAYVELSGRDVIAGIGDQVYLCLNVGSDFYKEFSPDEIKRLKMIVSRIDQMKG